LQNYTIFREDYCPSCSWVDGSDSRVETRTTLGFRSIVLVYGTTPKEVMIEQTLDWCRRMTEGYSELNEEMRTKLGKEWDY
jgi:hypothetical protein